MQNQIVTYYDDDNTMLEGYLVIPKSISEKRPGILICHDWSGRNEFAHQKAEQIAKLGYVAFALDMYGKGIVGKTKEEKAKLMQPLAENRKLVRKRVIAGFNTLKKQSMVDSSKIAAIGFCFGGLCVLDLARSGADLRGIVSFHGFFNPPTDLRNEHIRAKILAFHGADDPMVPFEQIVEFKKEMKAANADWQIHIFGNTMHAFTNPLANDAAFGTVYNAIADERSWLGMQDFFREIFSA